MTVESGGTSPGLLLGAMVGLVGLAVLVFVVTLLYLRGQDKEKDAERRAKRRGERDTGSRAQPVEAAAPVASPAGDLAAAEARGEVMRVIYDPRSSRVLIEVEGRRYESLREIEDAQVGRRVLWAIADLVRFTGGMATNPRAVRSVSEGVAWEAGPPEAAPGRATARPLPLSLSSSPDPDASPTNLGKTMSAFFQRGLNPPPSSGAAQSTSFVEQIDAILQEKLAEVDFPPAYEIRVSSGPDQRLLIQVGREVYHSIDEIPNLQAQSLIRAAVEEWERR